MLGARFKELGAFVSWAELVAASGLIGITYTNREPGDIHGLLDHIQHNAASLRIDAARIAVWACSGHGPNALSVLIERRSVTCAVLAYPYTLDLDGSTGIADAAKQFHFVTPAAGRSVKDLPGNLPLFIVRAGQDQMPGLNDALDRFVTEALAANLPLTVVNHPSGPHAFDLDDGSRTACDIVKQMLAFLQFQLSA